MPMLIVNSTVVILSRFIPKTTINGSEDYSKMQQRIFQRPIGTDFGAECHILVWNGNGLINQSFNTLIGLKVNPTTGKARQKTAWKFTTTELGMMILVLLNYHMYAKKLLKQNGAQLLHYLGVKRNVGKLEQMKTNVEEYLVVA